MMFLATLCSAWVVGSVFLSRMSLMVVRDGEKVECSKKDWQRD